MEIGYVYKITSPSGKIYIGSSKNYLNRWECYRFKRYKFQHKLKASFEKHGFENHTLEVIWEGSINIMLQKEQEYGILFNVLDRDEGLNLRLPKINDQYKSVSEETVDKMKKARKGKSAYWCNKIVSIYTLNGEYIKTFTSLGECANYLNCKICQVTKVLKGEAKQYKGYQIEYGNNTNNIKKYKEKNYHKYDKIIGKYSKDDKLLETFTSVREIVNKYKYNTCNLYECLNNKRKTTKGYKWKYIT
jgi:group I intron endonuclease